MPHMTKQLRTISLFFVLFSFFAMTAQSQQLAEHSTDYLVLSSKTKNVLNSAKLQKKVFSDNIDSQKHSHDHEDEFHVHDHKVVLLDIISSEENSDFNCSGGFCMNRSHFHKKGLTLKRQFFEYFMSISC